MANVVVATSFDKLLPPLSVRTRCDDMAGEAVVAQVDNKSDSVCELRALQFSVANDDANVWPGCNKLPPFFHCCCFENFNQTSLKTIFVVIPPRIIVFQKQYGSWHTTSFTA